VLRKNFIGIIALLCQNSMRTENSEMPCRDGRPILAASYFVFARMHMLVELGPFLCVALLAAPLAQLQSLILVDRGPTQGLRQLQIALKTAGPARKDSLPAALRAEIRPTAGDLHWKVGLLRQLQSELSSLYAFDETLLGAMQEGPAVFAVDGRVMDGTQLEGQFFWSPDSRLASE
jgi:hypothetical protein